MKFFLKRLSTILFILGVIVFVSFTTYRKMKTRRIINETLASEHWTERTKEFQEQARSTGRIVFLGNSLTEGFDLNILGDSTIINRGISGDFTEGVLKRLDEVVSLKPSRLFIEIGINDLIEKVPVKEICRNYRQIVERVQKASPSTQIYIQSLLPVRMQSSFLTSSEDVNEVVGEQNMALKALADKMKIPFIDLYSHFVVNNEMNPRLTYDGIHLVNEGYQIWKAEVLPYLK
jgi:lysophospholipase L1-like esterase